MRQKNVPLVSSKVIGNLIDKLVRKPLVSKYCLKKKALSYGIRVAFNFIL